MTNNNKSDLNQIHITKRWCSHKCIRFDKALLCNFKLSDLFTQFSTSTAQWNES